MPIQIDENYIQIERKEYERLLDIEAQYDALHRGGVENWEWYGDAMDDYLEQTPDPT